MKKNKPIEDDHRADLVGTWTCLTADHAEALVFKADGSFASYGVSNGEYWEDLDATWELKNNKLTLASGDYKSDVVLEIIPGTSMALVDKKGKRNVFEYCANDLADEIAGMWVCNNGPTKAENDAAILSFLENGKMSFTGFSPIEGDFSVKSEDDYKVVGNLLFITQQIDGVTVCNASQVAIASNGTSLGDILVNKVYAPVEDNFVETTTAFLRVKQTLDLKGNKYNYHDIFVSNVDGADKDINFMGYTFNFANMDGSGLDKMLKAILFNVNFPNANKLNYSYMYNNNTENFEANIVVEGNKMTIKMSEKVPTLKDVVLYAFLDVDGCQMHIYMHRNAFVNFYTNMQALLLEGTDEQFDITNAEAVNAIYNNINDAVETINVSLVMTAAE